MGFKRLIWQVQVRSTSERVPALLQSTRWRFGLVFSGVFRGDEPTSGADALFFKRPTIPHCLKNQVLRTVASSGKFSRYSRFPCFFVGLALWMSRRQSVFQCEISPDF
jgi:hypothetical protein